LVASGLNLPIEALRIIEESSGNNPDTLQTNFEIVDECGNKGAVKKSIY